MYLLGIEVEAKVDVCVSLDVLTGDGVSKAIPAVTSGSGKCRVTRRATDSVVRALQAASKKMTNKMSILLASLALANLPWLVTIPYLPFLRTAWPS